MSRGLGRVQRAVLAHLAAEPLRRSTLTGLPVWEPVREITAAVFQSPGQFGAQPQVTGD